jgi:TonB-linked SusC/RagA family outer membrane protein
MYNFYSKIVVRPHSRGRTAQLLLTMKLTVLLIFAAMLQVSASTYAQKITLNKKKAALMDVFQDIRKQSGYDFVFTASTMEKANLVDINVKSVELDLVLKQLFADQQLDYVIKDKSVIISQKKLAASNKQNEEVSLPPITIKGVVKDSLGKPLVGATVKILGTNAGVITNNEGAFELLNVPENGSMISISFIGFRAINLFVDKNTNQPLSIILKEDISKLNEVTVATGYQKIRKEQFVGSYSQLDSAAYSRRIGVNILDRLDGTVTGVLQDKKGGTNAAKSFQIRGLSTIESGENQNVSTPLLVLDGFTFTGNIDEINQNDIESITVLKDAAAAAVWGARAGNGVIVITTKKGKFNRPMAISVNSNVNITEKPDLYYIPKITSAEYIDVERFLFGKGFYDGKLNNTDFPNNFPAVSPVVELLAQARANPAFANQANSIINGMSNNDLRNDLDKYIYRNAITHQQYLNINGGTSALTYNLSAGYNRSLNNIKNSRPNDSYTLKSNTTYRPTKNLELTVDLSLSQSINKSTTSPVPNNAYPYMQLADGNGNALAIPYLLRQSYIDTVGKGKLLDWNYRPLDVVRDADNTNESRLLMISVGVNYRINSWLNADLKYQNSSATGSLRSHYSAQSFVARDLINSFTNLSQSNADLRNPVPVGGIIDLSNNLTQYQQGRVQLNFNKTWSKKNELTAFISGDISNSVMSSNGSRLYGYDSRYGTAKTNINYLSLFPIINSPSFTSQVPVGNASISENNINRLVSLSSNISYSYDNRYTIYGSARRDGANLFGATTNNRWKPLWSVGASWNISNENFFKVSWIESLRLKGSFGFLGNISPNVSALSTFTYRGASTKTGLIFASIRTPPNPDLRWEQVKVLNFGTEISVLGGRLSGSLEVFKKTSTDIISGIPVDPSVGVFSAVVNSASLQGKGFELNVSSLNTTGSIKWRSNFGLTYTRTIVTKVFNSGFRASDFILYGLHPAEGQLAYTISSYKWAGLDPLTGDPQGFLNGQVSKDYVSISADSVKNQVINGSSVPLYFGFLGNTVSWKGFSLSANINYRLKFYYRKPTINYSSLVLGQAHSDYSSRWQKPGDEATTNVPSFTYPLNSNRDEFYTNSEINVLRGDNIRLQDISLQYNLQNNRPLFGLMKNVRISAYINNMNLILWKKDKSGLDPDYSGGSDPSAFPAGRVYSIGLNANF